MDLFRDMKRLKLFSIICLSSFGILYVIFTKVLAKTFSVWFTPGFIVFLHVFTIVFFVFLLSSIVFSKINKQVLIMKHFQDELEETNITMKRIREDTEKKNMQLMQVNEQLSNLHRIIREMAQTMDLDRILGAILEGICKYLSYDHAIIFLIDEDKRLLKVIHSLGFQEEIANKIEISLHEKKNPIVMTVLEKRPQVIKNFNSLSVPMYGDIVDKNILGAVPLEARGRIIGVLVVDNIDSKNPLNENNLRDLLIFTNQAGLAIENARLYETEKQFKEELQRQVDLAIKKLHQTQAQLIQSEKLAALGEMAAIVTHEVRNPLSTIRGSAELINEITPNENPSKKYISFITKEVDRLNRIVTDILSFSRPPRLAIKQVDINSIIEELWIFLEASDFVKYDIQGYKELDKNISVVPLDTEQIKQVLLNIVQNACHFMVDSKIKQLGIKTYSNTKNVYVDISDTGIGISPENIKKIFDPFFTTKVRGTGLGLSVSKNIIGAHKGKISVKSQLGVGTIFTVSLPLVQKKDGKN